MTENSFGIRGGEKKTKIIPIGSRKRTVDKDMKKGEGIDSYRSESKGNLLRGPIGVGGSGNQLYKERMPTKGANTC